MSFYKTFNKLCKVHDNTIVFRDWLDYIIDMLIVRGYHHVELLKQELKSIYPDMNDNSLRKKCNAETGLKRHNYFYKLIKIE